MGVVLGVDLGTSFTSAAAVRDDTVVVVEDERGRRAMPSVVHFGPKGEEIVGYEALPKLVKDPENTIHSAKRLLGARFDDPPVRIAKSAYLYRIAEGPNQWPFIETCDGPHAIPAVCAALLKAMRSRAEHFFGEPVARAVITVPANANDSQREQTRIAGKIAGLDVIGLLNEPTAAAHAYALLRVGGSTMAVYDFGGGTFDCSVIRREDKSSTVLATHGDPFLGGDDIDLALAVAAASDFKRRTGVDIRGKSADWMRLLLACEEAKRRLSHQPKVLIRIPAVAHLATGAVDLEAELGREHLEKVAAPFVEQTVAIMGEAVTMGGLAKDQLDQVLLVGGSSRLPMVRRMVQEAFDKVPLVDIDPETAVCIGAAAAAYRAVGGRSPTIERAHARVVEVVPRSIGLATAGGGFDPVIAKNTPLPARGGRRYTTWRDDQTEMRFVVLQGESDRSTENVRLGEFAVSNLPPLPAGRIELELLFEVGDDGLLRVSARNSATGDIYRMGIRVADVVAGGR